MQGTRTLYWVPAPDYLLTPQVQVSKVISNLSTSLDLLPSFHSLTYLLPLNDPQVTFVQ